MPDFRLNKKFDQLNQMNTQQKEKVEFLLYFCYIRCEMTPTSAGGEQQNYIRCEMTPTSVGGEQQISISGGSQSPI